MLSRTEYRTDTSREPCSNSTSSIAHPLEQNAQEAESYTHGQVHTCSIAHLHEYRTHTSRHNSTSSIAHPLELNAQEAESYIHGQVRTCSITCLRELTTPSNNSLRHIHIYTYTHQSVEQQQLAHIHDRMCRTITDIYVRHTVPHRPTCVIPYHIGI